MKKKTNKQTNRTGHYLLHFFLRIILFLFPWQYFERENIPQIQKRIWKRTPSNLRWPRQLIIYKGCSFSVSIQSFASTHSFPIHPFSTPLKTSENLTVFRCFQGVEKGCIGNEWVNGFGWTNIASTNNVTWTSITTTNGFTWTNSININRFTWTNITSTKRFILMKLEDKVSLWRLFFVWNHQSIRKDFY